eukprot:GGOE01005730.1.p1 GENE.GGOE01005730.1~~GGOE01005730.1.p1  ORF type:complete len:527 (-),score=103.30 GGOE01005730.1:288-1868(-)
MPWLNHATSMNYDPNHSSIEDAQTKFIYYLVGQMKWLFHLQTTKTESIVHYGESANLGQTSRGDKTSYSSLIYYSSQLVHPTLGFPEVNEEKIQELQGRADVRWFDLGRTTNPAELYNSPIVHRVTLKGLKPGTKYFYQVEGDQRTFSFRMPSDHLPMKIGLTGDVGQTAVSNATLRALAAFDPDMIFFAGDLSYADGWGWRWDSFGRLMEVAATRYPFLACPGNHELLGGEAYIHYNSRWSMPHRWSGSPDNTFFSYEVGPIHLISLNSYAATTLGSIQSNWLLQDLGTVRRSVTPWIVVMFHAPYYNSNRGHQGEASAMRSDVEELFYNAGVDVVVSGHIHAYERTFPVFQNDVNLCGPVYLNVGDGGNREGTVRPWVDPQPAWSAFREASFGAGLLTVHNATHAHFLWHRHACEAFPDPGNMSFRSDCKTMGDNAADPLVVSDEVWITRLKGCANKRFTGSGSRWPEPDTEPTVASEDDGLSLAATLAILFAVLNVVLLVLLLWQRRRTRQRFSNVERDTEVL